MADNESVGTSRCEMATGRILVVDDNPAYLRLLEEAIAGVVQPVTVHPVNDGATAVNSLIQRPGDNDSADLVFLDWNLPQMTGGEVLEAIRNDGELHSIPVVVFSNSDDFETVLEAYESGANAYVYKPDDFDDIIGKVRGITGFWLDV